MGIAPLAHHQAAALAGATGKGMVTMVTTAGLVGLGGANGALEGRETL
ncbi:hypothetical protein RAM80_11715 [Pseudomonas sp. App30]